MPTLQLYSFVWRMLSIFTVSNDSEMKPTVRRNLRVPCNFVKASRTYCFLDLNAYQEHVKRTGRCNNLCVKLSELYQQPELL
jgi:hypothetical protein